EVRYALLPEARRDIARVREVPLEREIEVVGLERNEAGVIGRTGWLEAVQRGAARRTDRGTRVQVAIVRTRDRLAVGEPALQRVRQADVEVEARQQVAVVGLLGEGNLLGRTVDAPVVVRIPNQIGRQQDLRSGGDIRLL